MKGWGLFDVFYQWKVFWELNTGALPHPRVPNESDPSWEQQRRDLENSGEMSRHEGNSRLAKLDEGSTLSLLLVLVKSQDTTRWDILRSFKGTYILKKAEQPSTPTMYHLSGAAWDHWCLPHNPAWCGVFWAGLSISPS